MNIDLTPIFQAIIALLAALVTYKLIPWIRSKTTEQQQNNLEAAARIAVYAAQQLWGAARSTNTEKLDYAVSWLENAGFHVDYDVLRAAVEKAVYEMKLYASEDDPGITHAPPDEGADTNG